MNPPSHAKTRAAEALAALAARGAAQGDDLPASIQDLVCDLGHLCDDNKLDFVAILTRAIRHWQVERIDPGRAWPGSRGRDLHRAVCTPQPPQETRP